MPQHKEGDEGWRPLLSLVHMWQFHLAQYQMTDIALLLRRVRPFYSKTETGTLL